MKKKKRTRLSLSFEEKLNRDLVLASNPVLIHGLALAPVIAASVSLKNALILSLAAFILIIPTRFIGDLFVGIVPFRLRPMFYSFISALLFIPTIIAVDRIFGVSVVAVGIYLPMLVVDNIVLSRAEIPSREGPLEALRNGILTSIGLSLVLIIVGAVREFLDTGKLYGIELLKSGGPLAIAGTTAGGFILVALLAALFQYSINMYKRWRYKGARDNVR
ncbi:MAG: Rnf-Nqr domain containing protein [Oscillospiraceae bacterium]